MGRRKDSKKKKLHISDSGTGELQVRKPQAEQLILHLKQLRSHIYQVFTDQRNEDFTLLKQEVQRLGSQINNMPFTFNEKKSVREAAQQIAVIPSLIMLEEIGTKLLLFFDVIKPLAERIGVAETIMPTIDASQNTIRVVQEKNLSTDPEVLIDLIDNLPYHFLNALTYPSRDTRAQLSTVLNNISDQTALLGNSVSHNARLRMAGNHIVSLLEHEPASLINEKLTDFISALVVSIPDLNIPTEAEAALLQSLEGFSHSSRQIVQQVTFQQTVVSLHSVQKVSEVTANSVAVDATDAADTTDAVDEIDVADAVDVEEAIDVTYTTEVADITEVADDTDVPDVISADVTDATNVVDAPAVFEVTNVADATELTGYVEISGSGSTETAGFNSSTDRNGPAGVTEHSDKAVITEITGEMNIIEEVNEGAEPGDADVRGVSGENGEMRETDNKEEAGAVAKTKGAGLYGNKITIGGSLSYNSGTTQLVTASSPITFNQCTMQGLAFNGTTIVTVVTNGFYYFDWQVSLSADQVPPSTFGIVVNGNHTSSVNMNSSSANAEVAGSAVINLAAGNTVQLYNLSSVSKEINASSTGAKLTIVRIDS